MRRPLNVLETLFPDSHVRREFLRATRNYAVRQLEQKLPAERLRPLVRQELRRVIKDAAALGRSDHRFNEFLRRYQTTIRHAVRRGIPSHMREESEQELLVVLLRLHRRIADSRRGRVTPKFYSPDMPYSAYIRECGKNTARGCLKRAARLGNAWPFSVEDLMSVPDRPSSVGSSDATQALRIRLVRARVHGLPDRQREVVQLRLEALMRDGIFLESKEVARILGVKVNAVNKAYAAAKNSLVLDGIHLTKLKTFATEMKRQSPRRDLPSLPDYRRNWNTNKDMEA